MPRHPGEYARDADRAPAAHDATVWLVNTGWTGGPYGTGERMNIAHTRAMVRAALDGALADVADAHRPGLRRRGPAELPGRAGRLPRSALDLGGPRRLRPPGGARSPRMFADNFSAYADGVVEDVRAAGPVVSGWTPPTALDPDPGAG